MKEVLLHIGTEKTGTSTIQNYLSKNRAELINNHEILYPSSIGKNNHQRLCLLAAPNSIRTKRMRLKFGLVDDNKFKAYSENLLSEFQTEIDASKATRVLISSEHLSSRLHTSEEISKLKDILSSLGLKAKIIVYFRRQDELIPSEYSTSLKVGNVVKLDEEKHNFWFNYFDLASSWSSVFGKENLICRAFDKVQYVNNNLMDDFLSILRVDIKSTGQFDQRANPSLSGKMLMFLSDFNKRVPFSIDNKVNPSRANIARLLQRYQSSISDNIKLSLTDVQRKVVLKRYRTQNLKLQEEFGLKMNLELDNLATSETSTLSIEEIYDIFGYLWTQKQEEVNSLKRLNESKTKDVME